MARLKKGETTALEPMAEHYHPCRYHELIEKGGRREMGRRKKGETTVLEPVAEHHHSCRHHWLIETPHGATSRGVCLFCGQAKEFKNILDEDIIPWREREEAPPPLEDERLGDLEIAPQRV